VNPLERLLLAVVLLADVCVPFFAVFAGLLSAIAKHLRASFDPQPLELRCDRRAAQRSS
jgi:hypothetical protein